MMKRFPVAFVESDALNFLIFQYTCVHDIQDGNQAENLINPKSVRNVNMNDSPETSGVAENEFCEEPTGRGAPSIPTRRKISLRRSNPLSSDNGQSASVSNIAGDTPSQPLQAASPPFIMSVAVDNQNEDGLESDSPSNVQQTNTNATTGRLDRETESGPTECPSENDSQEAESAGTSQQQFYPAHNVPLGESVTFIIRSGAQVAERTLLLLGQSQPPRSQNLRIIPNKSRLTHHIEEPNVGRGFIKEMSFSNDGRVICSPFGYGFRLLAFGPQCQELCDLQPRQPMHLYELTSNSCHANSVVASKFSPTHCLLVTGCLSGKVNFHQPVL